MKTSSLSILLSFLTIAFISAEGLPRSIYAAAFPHSSESASPGSFVFSKKGEQMFLSVRVVSLDLDVSMPVVIRASDFQDGHEKVFDAIYVAEDGLSSVVVTGRLSEDWGGGVLVRHYSAASGASTGGIDKFTFNMTYLKK